MLSMLEHPTERSFVVPQISERVRNYALRIPEHLFLEIQQHAKEEHRSINAQIIHILHQAVGTKRMPRRGASRRAIIDTQEQ